MLSKTERMLVESIKNAKRLKITIGGAVCMMMRMEKRCSPSICV